MRTTAEGHEQGTGATCCRAERRCGRWKAGWSSSRSRGATTWAEEHPLVAPGSVGACSAAAARKLWSPTLPIVRPVWKSRQMTTVGKKPHRLITRAHRVLIFAVGSFGRAGKGNEDALVSWRARMVIRVCAATCLLPCVRLGASSAPDLVCHQPGDHLARCWCTQEGFECTGELVQIWVHLQPGGWVALCSLTWAVPLFLSPTSFVEQQVDFAPSSFQRCHGASPLYISDAKSGQVVQRHRWVAGCPFKCQQEGSSELQREQRRKELHAQPHSHQTSGFYKLLSLSCLAMGGGN